MTRRKPSWTRNDESLSTTANGLQSPTSTEPCNDFSDNQLESPSTSSFDNYQDVNNGNNTNDVSGQIPADSQCAESHTNETNERDGSGSSSTGKCPFMASPVLSAASPVPSRCSEMTTQRVLSKSQLRDYREAFRIFDKDGDGSITTQELDNVMRSLGQHAMADELRQMLAEIDSDGDGTVSFEEFVNILENMSEESCESSAEDEERELRDAFRIFDKHNRGYITASDLRQVLRCLGEDLREEDIEEMIREVDVDGDGKIDFYEFVNALGEPENTDEDDDDDDECDDEVDATSIIKTVITSPLDSPHPGAIENVKSSAPNDAQAGPSKSPIKKANEPFTVTVQPKGTKRTSTRQHKSRPPSRPMSRSVSPDPAHKSVGNSLYERRRSPSLKDAAANQSNLDVKSGEGNSRRLSRSGLISEEIAQIGRASFRESYKAIVKPTHDSNPDSPTSKTYLYTSGISDMAAFRALMNQSHDKNRTVAKDEATEVGDSVATEETKGETENLTSSEHHFESSGSLPSNTRSARLFERNVMEDSFDIGGEDVLDNGEFEIEEIDEPIVDDIPDIGEIAYKQIPGFVSTAFYLCRTELAFPLSNT